MRYRRTYQPNGSYFFTLALASRSSNTLVCHIDKLRTAVAAVKRAHPFNIEAMVVLPDHLHAIWTLPDGDCNYPMRWSLIKSGFSRQLPRGEPRSVSRVGKRERGIWQRRYWEHCVRDQKDLQAHIDYIHYNPVKHGYVARVCDWPYSSFHQYVRRGELPWEWGGGDQCGSGVNSGVNDAGEP